MATMIIRLLVACVALTFTVSAQNLTAILETKEAAVNNIVADAEAYHRNRCGMLSGVQPRCSIYSCGNVLPDGASTSRWFNCSSTYGRDPALCGQNCPGLRRSFDSSVVRISRSASPTDVELRAFVSSSERLTTTFVSNQATGTLNSWQYMGSFTGGTRMYPGAMQGRSEGGGCSAYEPRLRPWYIAASSGPKDVVLLMDVSGSMRNRDGSTTRIELMKAAVLQLLDTFTHNDFVNVVVFSDANSASTRTLNGLSSLVVANEANLKVLKDAVRGLQPTGGTYVNYAFQKAFSVFTASGTESTSGGPRMIMFLTDGHPSDGGHLSTIETSQNSLASLDGRRAHIFTYSMSSDASHTLPKSIACANNGIWASIADGEDPLVKMSQYYQFLAAGVDDNTVRWTTPYVDAFGMGEMVTAARAVYDRSKSIPLLVGVVGTDILMSDLEAHSTYQTVVTGLIQRSANVPNFNISACQLQYLRSQADADGTCPGDPSISTCDSQGEIVSLTKCPDTSVSKAMDSLLCEPIISGLHIGSGTFQSLGQMSCCVHGACSPTDVDAAAPLAGMSALVAALLLVVASLLMN